MISLRFVFTVNHDPLLYSRLGPGRTRQIFVYFAKKFVIISVIQVRPVFFFSHQILSSITKLQRRRRPALEQDKFLSGVKTVQILQFAMHDLKRKFLSASTITKLKIWQRQILSRFLDGPNKFCQSSASGPLVKKLFSDEIREVTMFITSLKMLLN